MKTLRTVRSSRAAVLLVVGALALAACDDDDGNEMMSQGIDSLGDDFGTAYNQDRNDAPVEASDLSLTLTPSIEPFDP